MCSSSSRVVLILLPKPNLYHVSSSTADMICPGHTHTHTHTLSFAPCDGHIQLLRADVWFHVMIVAANEEPPWQISAVAEVTDVGYLTTVAHNWYWRCEGPKKHLETPKSQLLWVQNRTCGLKHRDTERRNVRLEYCSWGVDWPLSWCLFIQSLYVQFHLCFCIYLCQLLIYSSDVSNIYTNWNNSYYRLVSTL